MGSTAHWYNIIRTQGDPDVHFSGFSMERTKDGGLRSGRISIGAESYGVPLVSAISSLSESKLNTLGLCTCIAASLSQDAPFDFIVIDDPIQSMDEEHEAQFVQLLGSLVDAGKQVVLLSHNQRWVKQVVQGCRSYNGIFYEITGYTKAGPHIASKPWEEWGKRLAFINGLANDPHCGMVEVQAAEQEIRIVVTDLASELYLRKHGERKSTRNMGSAEVKRLLTSCGVEQGLVNRIGQTFATSDEAHHASESHAVSRNKVKTYANWATDLMKVVEQTPAKR